MEHNLLEGDSFFNQYFVWTPENLRIIRKRRGMTLHALSHKTIELDMEGKKKGITVYTISGLEASVNKPGTLNVNTRTLCLLRDALNIKGWII